MKTFLIFTCSLIFLNLLIPEIQQSGTLEVTVTNVENSEGKIRAVLFRGEDGFPDEREKAYRSASVNARENKTTLIFEDIPYGEYAISLLHDENEDGKMDTNLFGYPQEGYGVSNNKTSGLSMPSTKMPASRWMNHIRTYLFTCETEKPAFVLSGFSSTFARIVVAK